MKQAKKNAPMLTISIGEKDLPCRVTMGAMVRFKRSAGYDISQLDSSNLEDLLVFIWCCVLSACNADGVEFDMDFETFADKLNADDVARFFQSMDSPESDEKKTTPRST